MSVVDDLHQARETYERREWLAAYRALSDLDDAHLQADDFAALAITAFLLGHRNDCVQALQRAYQAELEEDDTLGAVRAAYWLAITLWQGGEVAIGNGWLARGQRLLEPSRRMWWSAAICSNGPRSGTSPKGSSRRQPPPRQS